VIKITLLEFTNDFLGDVIVSCHSVPLASPFLCSHKITESSFS
jgi:hypothetical protein